MHQMQKSLYATHYDLFSPRKKITVEMVPLKGGIGGIVHPPIGWQYYIPLIYCLVLKTKENSLRCSALQEMGHWDDVFVSKRLP